MYLMIDNYDSFVFNLVRYFRELGEEITVARNDRITREEIRKMELLEGIIISPGPGTPEDGGISGDIIREFAGRVPILGICLGHQIIGTVYGADVAKGFCPMHGKISRIHHRNTGLFSKLPDGYQVTRYHSLVVRELPDCLEADAYAEDRTLMAMHHKKYPVYGVQFHPEAVMTEYGHELIQNFIDISRRYRRIEA